MKVVLDTGFTGMHLKRQAFCFYLLKFGHPHTNIDWLLSVVSVKESKHTFVYITQLLNLTLTIPTHSLILTPHLKTMS